MARRFCPYLGLRDDADSHISYPSYDNFCYASGERRVVAMSEQARLCLSGQHTTCYHFAATARGSSRGARPETPPKTPPRPPRQVEEGVEKKVTDAPVLTTSPPEQVSSPKRKLKERFCPHLGSLSNRKVHAGYPSYNNFCYVSGRRHTVPMTHQGKFCLRREFTACPRLMAAPPGETPKSELPTGTKPVKEPAPEAKPQAAPKAEPTKPVLAQPIDIVAIANLAIQGKFSEAIAETERATGDLASDLARSLVWGLLVSSYSEATGDLVSDFVFSCWKKALDLDPGNFRPYYGLAFYYAGYEDYPNALWAASQVLELAPKDDPAYNGIWQFIGMVEQKIGTRAVERYLAHQDA